MGRFMSIRSLIASALAILSSASMAAVETTTVTGTVYTPSAIAVSGGDVTCALTPNPGRASDGTSMQVVASRYKSTINSSGFVSITLVPNDQITPSGTVYLCRFSITGPVRDAWDETWSVATSPDPISIGAVSRVSGPSAIPPLTASVAGAEATAQYRCGNALCGDGGITIDGTSDKLTVTGSIEVGQGSSASALDAPAGITMNPDSDNNGTGNLTLKGNRIDNAKSIRSDFGSTNQWERVVCGDRDQDGTLEYIDDFKPCACEALGYAADCTGSATSRDLTGDGTADGAGVEIVLGGMFQRKFWQNITLTANYFSVVGSGPGSGINTQSGLCGGVSVGATPHSSGYLDDNNDVNDIGAALSISGTNVLVSRFDYFGGSLRSTYTSTGACVMDTASAGTGDQCSPNWCPQDSEQALSFAPNSNNLRVSMVRFFDVDRTAVTVEGLAQTNSRVEVDNCEFRRIGEHSIWQETQLYRVRASHFELCGENSKACIVLGGDNAGDQSGQLISGNTFQDCPGSCIGSELATQPGVVTRGLTIAGNVFRCTTGSSLNCGAAAFTTWSNAASDQKAESIAFVGNTISAVNNANTSGAAFVSFDRQASSGSSRIGDITIAGNTIYAPTTTAGRGRPGVSLRRCDNCVLSGNTIDVSGDSSSDQAYTSHEAGIRLLSGTNNLATGNAITCTTDGCNGYEINTETNTAVVGGSVTLGTTATSVDQRVGIYGINNTRVHVSSVSIRGPASASASFAVIGVLAEGTGPSYIVEDNKCSQTSQCVFLNCGGTNCANSIVSGNKAFGGPSGNVGVHFLDTGTSGTSTFSRNVSLGGFVDAANEGSSGAAAKAKGVTFACDEDANGTLDATCREIAGVSLQPCAEGATNDAFETCDDLVDPTADRTITKPNASGRYVIANSAATTAGAALWTSTTTSCTTICADVSLTCRDAYPGAGGASVGCANTAANRTCWCSAL